MNMHMNRRLLSTFIRTIKIEKMKVQKTPIINCDEKDAINSAAELLLNEEVIAVPTDTIYGLACSANSPKAIQNLYNIKGRDLIKPVAICVSNVDDVRRWGDASHLTDKLLYSLLPGPVTIVLKRTKNLDNPFLNPQTMKIGIRIPNHEFINKLTNVFNRPIALTSANFSNEPSSLCIEEFKVLYDKLGAVFEGGVLSLGLDVNRSGSTIIDLSQAGVFSIIRKGISYDKIIDILQKNGYTNIPL